MKAIFIDTQGKTLLTLENPTILPYKKDEISINGWDYFVKRREFFYKPINEFEAKELQWETIVEIYLEDD